MQFYNLNDSIEKDNYVYEDSFIKFSTIMDGLKKFNWKKNQNLQ